MTQFHLGTMGFGYSEWADVFYPPGTKPSDYLSHYARHFDTVELDTTFHAIPPVDRVRAIAASRRFMPMLGLPVRADQDLAEQGKLFG